MTDFESTNQFGEFIRAILLSFSLSITMAITSIGLSQSHRKKISLKSGFILLLICTSILVSGIIYVISSILHTPWPANDFPNWAAVVIEIAVAVFITGMIFLYDREHNKKSEERQEKKRKYGLQKIRLLVTVAKEQFQDNDYDDAKETFNEIIVTLGILSEAFDAVESRQILELCELGKIFCKYNGEYIIRSGRTSPFTTSVPANKAALFLQFDDVLNLLSKNENQSQTT